MKSPTEKQIRLAEQISAILDIDFPSSSKDFTRHIYYHFIKNNIEEFKYAQLENYIDEDDCNEICINDVWTEEY